MTSPLSSLSDVRKLIIFRTISQAGSLRRAARQLKVTPSAISQSLSSLEKQLGKPLILRDRGQFQMTDEGEKLLQQYQGALDVLDGFSLETSRSPSIVRLDLGTYESLAMDVLPQMISLLKRDHPHVKLHLTIARSGNVLQKLRSGELCTGLVVETDGIEGFSTITVAEDELGLFIRTGAENHWKSVEDLGLGMISPGIDGHPLYYSKFIKSLGKVRSVLTSDSFEVLRVAARSGHVVSLLPKRVAHRQKGELVEITERPQGASPELGRHKIVIAYLDRCDNEEAKYLANLVRTAISSPT